MPTASRRRCPAEDERYGADWQNNPVTQIQWGLAYIGDSYGTPCGAWSTFQSKGWY